MSDPYTDFLNGTQAPSEGPKPVESGAGQDEYSKFLNGVTAPKPAEQPVDLQAAANESDVVPDQKYSRFLESGVQQPGYMDLFTTGVHRGWVQTKAMVPSLKSIGQELTGDMPGAIESAKQANEIMKETTDSTFDLTKIHSPEDFLGWSIEKLGEQGVNIAAMLATGGTSGAGMALLTNRLLARGLITEATARTLVKAGVGASVYGASTAMETAGTTQEQFDVTGTPQAGLSLGAGATKGLLELWTPMHILGMASKPASGLVKEIGKTMLGEGATEYAQELIDIAARKYNDPKYSFFGDGPDWWNGPGFLRAAESGAAGAVVGGAYGGAGHALTHSISRVDENGQPLQKPGDVQVLKGTPQEPAAPMQKGPVSVLRDQVLGGQGPQQEAGKLPGEFRQGLANPVADNDRAALNTIQNQASDSNVRITPGLRDNDNQVVPKPLDVAAVRAKIAEQRRKDFQVVDRPLQEALRSDPRNDLWSISPLLRDVVSQPSRDALLDLYEANTPRYAEIQPNGKLGSHLKTDTEIELNTAMRKPQSEKPRLLRVDQSKLQPAAMSATVFDLPPIESGRVWFLPNVTPEAQANLTSMYSTMQGLSAGMAEKASLTSKEAQDETERMVRPIYDKLLKQGLRVIPSRGSGFYYDSAGTLTGTPVTDLMTTGRTAHIGIYDPMTRQVTTFYADKEHLANDLTVAGNTDLTNKLLVSVDTNKLRDSDVVFGPDKKTFILKAPLRVDALVPGILPQDTKRISEVTLSYPLYPGVQVLTEDILPENEERANEITRAAKQMQPGIERLLKDLDIGGNLVIIVTDNTTPFEQNGYEEKSPGLLYHDGSLIYLFPKNFELDEWRMNITPAVDTLSTIMHELGHIVTFKHYRNLPTELQQQLLYAWDKANLSERLVEQSFKSPALAGTISAPEQKSYYLTFPEYLAEQFRRWSTSTDPAYSYMTKAFAEGGRKLEAFYKSWEARYGAQAALDLQKPDYAFTAFMDYLRNFSSRKANLEQLMKQQSILSVDDKVLSSPASLDITNQVRLALQSMQAMFPEPVQVSLKEQLSPHLAQSSEAAAKWVPEISLIELAMGALQPTDAQKESRIYLSHEVMHAYEDLGLITEQELKILDADIVSKPDRLGSAYRAALRKRVQDFANAQNLAAKTAGQPAPWSFQRTEAKFGEMLAREERAYYIQDFADTGVAQSTEARDIISRILAILERVRNFLNGLGYQTREDVRRAFFKGEIAARYERTETAKKAADGAAMHVEALRNPIDSLVTAWRAFKLHMRQERKMYDESNFRLLFEGFKDWLRNPTVYNAKDQLSFHYEDTKNFYEKIKQIEEREKASKNEGPQQEALRTPKLEEPTRTWTSGNMTVQAFYDGPGSVDYKKTSNYIFYHWLDQAGNISGVLELKSHGTKGHEIAWIQSDRFGLGMQMIREAERDLGMQMKVSGELTADGWKQAEVLLRSQGKGQLIKLWQQVTVNGDPREYWVSPNWVLEQLSYWQEVARSRTKQEELQITAPEARERVANYKELYNALPKQIWTDGTLDQMFSLRRNYERDEVQGSLLREGQRADESKLLESVGQGTSFQDAFSRTAQIKQMLSRADNARSSGLSMEMSAPSTMLTYEAWNIRKLYEYSTGYGETAIEASQIKNMRHEADRIGLFTKLFLSINQLASLNPHLPYLQKYVELGNVNLSVAQTVLRGAEERARQWNEIPAERKDPLAQTFFDLSEMNYLLPMERKNKVVRLPANWADFLAGKPVPTNGELDRLFKSRKLSPAEITLVRNVSNDFMGFLKSVEEMRAKQLSKVFTSNPASLQVALAKLANEMNEMRAKPYFPMVRFGKYTLAVRDPAQKNRIVHASAYDTQGQRTQAIEKLRVQYPGEDFVIGLVPESSSEFMGLPLTLLRFIEEDMPAETGQKLTPEQLFWIEQFKQLHAPDRSFRNRWMPSKGVPGHSMDAFRMYAHYFQNGARYLARLATMQDMQASIHAVENSITSGGIGNTAKRTALVTYMKNHFNYIMEPGRDSAKFRGFFALYHLGFSPAAAAMNLTQIPGVLIPSLSMHFGMTNAYAQINKVGSSLRQSMGIAIGGPAFQKAREEMISQGRISIGQAAELAAYADGYNLDKLNAGTRTQKWWRKTQHLAMTMFSATEHYNREFTMQAAWQLAIKQPNQQILKDIAQNSVIELGDLQARLGLSHDEAAAFLYARKMIDDTQFQYNRMTDAPFMRGKHSKDFLIFFKYMQNMLFTLRYSGAGTHMLVVMAFLYGLGGLPGADELNELLRLLSNKLFGKDFDLKLATRRMVREATKGTIFDEVGPDVAMNGISRYGFGLGLLPQSWGMPSFDASANGSMGKIVPGLSEYMHSKTVGGQFNEALGDAAQKAAGAGYGTIISLMNFLMSDPFTADMKQWEKVFPRSVKSLSKAYRYGFDPGAETTKSGAQIVKFDITDPNDLTTVLAQAAGFTPTRVSETWDLMRAAKEATQIMQARRTALYADMDKAIRANNPAAMDDVKKAIADYNEMVIPQNPMMAIKNVSQLVAALKNRAQSREMQEQFLAPTKREVLITDRMKDLYPGVRTQPTK